MIFVPTSFFPVQDTDGDLGIQCSLSLGGGFKAALLSATMPEPKHSNITVLLTISNIPESMT